MPLLSRFCNLPFRITFSLFVKASLGAYFHMKMRFPSHANFKTLFHMDSFASPIAEFLSRAIRKMVENSRLIREQRQINKLNYERKETQVNLPFFRPRALVQSSCNAH